MEPADVKKVATTLKRAIKVVGTPAYEEMVKNCMVQDLSWKVLTYAVRAQSTKIVDHTGLAPVADCGGLFAKIMQGPAKNWENVLLSLGVAGGEPGIEGEEIAPLAKENVAAP